ncbi:CsgG/HfaB family protein [Salinimicrobium sediminilitoris]|uniref:CsgG/HfaB family protein n=1 Tax=Salinimicrobium sediminilitoris TaxID=2876715 RepID=UPI001E42F03A|nr:CsgG/HfaB family protein [Salinimicrobium sediminilitoris]MCC8360630.1 CsgG/HfaB family protein [Salinimicrobium sediminilitoris]
MRKTLMSFALGCTLIGCTVQQKVVQVEPQVMELQQPEAQGLKRKVAIARFSNETQYAKGIFYDKENDPITNQALDILTTKLASSNKFILLERQEMDKIMEEYRLSENQGQKVGADYLIIGSVTEFGRKNVGDVNAFSRSKTQTVQAGVSLRLVDVSTGQIIYSEEAKGEAETTSKTVMGLGERTDFDATLSDKAISVAISKLVENIINNCMDRPWKSYFLNYDQDGILISGGASQGIKVNDVFEVVEKGKRVKNPQTGMMVELPGKTVGKIKITYMGGENPQSEFSMVSFVEGAIDSSNLDSYYIKETEI